MFQENFQENITHVTLNYELPLPECKYPEIIDKIRPLVTNESTKRSPVIIYGQEGSGKTTLLRTVHRQIESWKDDRFLKIIRFVNATPRSSYALELVRIISQQICIALRHPDGFLPKDACFDPLYISNWFQKLVKNFEDLNQYLVIIFDDIHLLNRIDSDIGSFFNWLPLQLPPNVLIILSTGVPLDSFRLTQAQKDSLLDPATYFELSECDNSVRK